MKLYDVPRGARIKVIAVPETGQTYNEVLQFQYCDGMFGLCYGEDGKPVHIDAFTNVQIQDEER
jgi:hypothetical protein